VAGIYSTITRFDLPGTIEQGNKARYAVEGRLDARPDWPNFAVGLFYIDGPADQVKVWVDGREFNVSKGMGVVKHVEPLPEPGYTLSLAGEIYADVLGEYKFAAVTGYVENGTLYYDDRVDKMLEVKQPVAPKPTPEAPEIPWWPIAIAGAVTGIVAIAAVVAYQERKREEMLMMMLMR